MLVTVALCIRLGFWQQHKAEVKQALQSQLDQRRQEAPVALPGTLPDPESWRYRRVVLHGSYDPRYQVLLDNQVEGGVAGYHVLTPLRLEGSDGYVLVNRGWIAALADHQSVPAVATPVGEQELVGQVWLPPAKYFMLQAPPQGQGWQPVWQNLDLKRYASLVPFAVRPFVVRLEAASGADGLVRNWPRPAERIEMHIGYAYQWYGFAVAFAVIYLVLNIRKRDE